MTVALAKLQEALANKELTAYLMGENDYKFVDLWAETPTDLGAVFISGFNEYVRIDKQKKDELQVQLHRALNELLQTPVGTWWVISVVYSYLFGYQKDALQFEIDVDSLTDPINNNLQVHKDKLRGNKDWVGWRFTGGLLDDVIFMINQINSCTNTKKLKMPD
jgi:hypothetical protein